MEKLFEAYLTLLEGCHREMLKTLEGLPPEALDWCPAPETNSISVLIFHTTGSERYWIGDVAMGENSHRNREAEFAVKGVNTEVLKQRLDDSLAYARTAVERIKLEDLSQMRTTPSGDRSGTVAWALLHALEHASVHLGHIQITRQLWEQSQVSN